MPSLLDSLSANPLFNVGMGLLSQGPSRMPINPWQGVQSGMNNARYGQQVLQQQQMQAIQRQAMQQRMYQAHVQSAQEAAQRERMQQFIATLPPEQQAMAQANPQAFMTQYVQQQFAKPEQPQITQGADGYKYFTSGPQAGQRVLPNVQRQAQPEELVEVYDPDSPTLKSYVPRSQAAGRAAGTPQGANVPKLSDVASIRKEYQSESSQWQEVRAQYENIEAARPTAAGDISLVISYMKMLDPGSVVREGEFATAQNASGVPGQVRNLYNQMIDGQRLNPEQRKDFKSQAKQLLGAAIGQQRVREVEYRDIAERQGMDPSNVVRDLIGPYRSMSFEPAAVIETQEQYDQLPNGAEYIDSETGQTFVKGK